MKVTFFYLEAFDGVGGIQKYNQCFIKALSECSDNQVKLVSLYDSAPDSKYFANNITFRGFKGRKLRFLIYSIFQLFSQDKVVLGHINLGLLAFFVKIFCPGTKIITLTHGVEVWRDLSFFQKQALKADKVLTVSRYTRQELVKRHKVRRDRIELLLNTIDPYYNFPKQFSPDKGLRQRYGIGTDDKLLITVARIKSTEKGKGYDKVVEVLPDLQKGIPGLKYILVGKYDESEKNRLKELVPEEVFSSVIFAGYVQDNELLDHYLSADVFVMPSAKEGFGIVFIEAMLCGLPVIGGNKDGSVDALQDGQLGLLVDPDNQQELINAIKTALRDSEIMTGSEKKQLQEKVISYFGFERFKNDVKDKILF